MTGVARATNAPEQPERSSDLAASRASVFLSVVIPAYNEISRIPSALAQVVAYLESLGQSCELLVVDDGSTDGTAAVVEEVCRTSKTVRLLRNARNIGKGFAVRNGMLNARGEYLLFTDADLSAPIQDAGVLLASLQEGYDVVMGSRALRPEWIGTHQSRFRETGGKLFNLLLRAMTGLRFKDTQCGFKAFRRSAAQAIFSAQKIHGFGFDAEVVYLARKFGLRTLEVPVHWDHSHASKVHPLHDGARMVLDVLRIRWNDWLEKYDGQRPEVRSQESGVRSEESE